jgi:hypothetical protein
MNEVDHGAIRDTKNVCGGCGAPLRKVGEIDGDRRGEEFECTREACGYVERRMYGEEYYDPRQS